MKRNGFDVAACITLMYVITTFFSVILGNYDYQFKYENYSDIEIGIIPTFVFCFTIGICIYPFYKYNSNKPRVLKVISPSGVSFFNILVYLYLAVFILLIAIFWEDILFRLLFGNMGELRDMQYAGELTNVLDTKSGPIRRIGGILTILGDGAFFLIPCFFYSLCVLKKKTLFNFIILLGSLSPVVLGFIYIDRSKTAFWIMLFILSYVMFKQYIITKEQKTLLKKMVFTVGGLLILYLAVVTVSRFGEKDGGSSGGLLVYIGQPFLNFCNIWNNIDSNHFFTSRVLPLTTFAIHGSSGTEEIIEYIITSPSRTGLHLNVFFTFVGMFLVDMGHFAAILVPIILAFIITLSINKHSINSSVSLNSIIVVFAFAAILQCGIIIYFYTTVPRALAFWAFIFYSKKFLK